MKNFKYFLWLVGLLFMTVSYAQTTLPTMNLPFANKQVIGPFKTLDLSLNNSDTIQLYKNGQPVVNSTFVCGESNGCKMSIHVIGIKN